MFKCDKCGEFFMEPKRIKDGGGDIGEDSYACPMCGHDDFEEGTVCVECGAFIDDRCGRDCVCDECLAKHMDYSTVKAYADSEERPIEVPVNALLSYIFTPSEINEILEREVRETYKTRKLFPKGAELMDACIKEFIGDCRREFEDWVVSHG